jgi:trigger factor
MQDAIVVEKHEENSVPITDNLPYQGIARKVLTEQEQVDYPKDIDVSGVVVESGEVKYPIVNVLEEPEYCRLKVHYEADPEVVISKIDDAVQECRKLRVPGFRQGKAPDHIIKVRLRPQINQYVVREMATHAMDDIIFEMNIKPIGQPKFNDIKVSKNAFSCDIELTKKPEFELGNIVFDIPKPKVGDDEEVLAEKSLYNLRLRFGETAPYEDEDSVEVGDQVTFSFTATVDGEPFDGSTSEGELYFVGSNRWNGFDNNLFGMKADETREFELKFEDGPLVDKVAKFSVTIHMGIKKKPHPLDEDLFKIIGVKDIEELLNTLRVISQASIRRNHQEAIRSQVAIRLLENNKFEIPKFIISEEAKYIASQSGIVFDSASDFDKTKYLEQAEKNARLSLILDSVRESEPDSVLNEVEARNTLTQHIQASGGDPSLILKNEATSAMLLSSIKDEFTLQWISDKANIIE